MIQNFYDTFALNPPDQILPLTMDLMIGNIDAYPDGRYIDSQERNPIHIPEIGVFRFDLPVTIQQGLTLWPKQTSNTNEIPVELRYLEINQTATNALVCFHPPDTRDWSLQASLRTAGKVVYNHGWTLMDAKDPRVYLNDERCYLINFLLQYPEDFTDPLQFTIEKLVTGLPEAITEEKCAAAQLRLTLSGSGVLFSCTSIDNRFRLGIQQKPASMSEETAYQIIYDEFREAIIGPWQFDLPMIKMTGEPSWE